ncbi:unnamed protein product [Cuscuta epithymum]|uniref:Uncharacterized protein n=1 Tax=Cuscuta epithymum TaxID=186058 RepID=A0AAV0C3J3_9ASTE|nr:unnamed protein product [Cuscuta epithymum]
MFEQYQKIIA